MTRTRFDRRCLRLLAATGLILVLQVDNVAAEFVATGTATVTHAVGRRGIQLNRANRQEGEFNTLRLVVKGQATISPRVSLNLEYLLDQQASGNMTLTFLSPWVEVRELFDRPWLNFQVGKLPTVFGTWTERARTLNNPVLGVPLMYNYHTDLGFSAFPANGDTLIRRSGRGQFGFNYQNPAGTGFKGQPTVYEPCWDTAVQLYGARGSLEYAAALGYGSPGVPAFDGNENNREPGVTARLGASQLPGPLFGVRVGVSAATGAWLPSGTPLPGGLEAEDLDQTVFGADLEYGLGRIVTRGEYLVSRWETPENDAPATWMPAHLENRSWYLESRVDVRPDLFLGGRFDRMTFTPITSPAGVSTSWDANVDRLELGATWRPDPNVALRYAYQFWRYPGMAQLDADVYALQLQVTF